MSIITYPLNDIDYEAADVETYLSTRTSGVFSDKDDFAVSVTGDRTVTVAEGLAWIKNAAFAGKSVCNMAPVALAIEAADGSLPRIDRIVLRFDAALNASVLAVKKGTPASAPSAPSVERSALMYELGLYTVRVPAASISIADGDITDTRADASVCGKMRDGVTDDDLTFDAAEGSIMTVDANGALVASSRTIASLGTGATYTLTGTTLYINTL